MPRLDLTAIPPRTSTFYPAPFDALVAGRSALRLGDAGGLTQFGVNLVTLAPGAASSMRHWHEEEDEFVMVLEGALVMVTDAGDTAMAPGDCAAFPAGRPDAHTFVNRSDAPARFLVVGSKAAREVAHYPDQGLRAVLMAGRFTLTRADGSALPPAE